MKWSTIYKLSKSKITKSTDKKTNKNLQEDKYKYYQVEKGKDSMQYIKIKAYTYNIHTYKIRKLQFHIAE